MAEAPRSVVVIGVLNLAHAFLCGLICSPLVLVSLINGMLRAAGRNPNFGAQHYAMMGAAGVITLLIVVAAVASVPTSIYLMKLRPWARRWTLYLAAFWFVVYLIGSGIEALIVLAPYLSSPDPMGLGLSKVIGFFMRTMFVLLYPVIQWRTLNSPPVVQAFAAGEAPSPTPFSPAAV